MIDQPQQPEKPTAPQPKPPFHKRLLSTLFEHRDLPPVPHVFTAVYNADRENLYIRLSQ